MLVEIFLDGFLGFAHVDGEKDQSFASKLMADLVDEGGFVSAEAAPGGPEFQQNNLSFDGVVGEFFAGGRGGVEARGGLFVLGSGQQAARGEEKREGKCSSEARVFKIRERGRASVDGPVFQTRRSKEPRELRRCRTACLRRWSVRSTSAGRLHDFTFDPTSRLYHGFPKSLCQC